MKEFVIYLDNNCLGYFYAYNEEEAMQNFLDSRWDDFEIMECVNNDKEEELEEE